MSSALPVRDERNGRISIMRDDLRERLRPVTQGMPGDILDALINDMAVLQDKYEQIQLEGFCPTPLDTGQAPLALCSCSRGDKPAR